MNASFVIAFDGQWRIARLAGAQVEVRDLPAGGAAEIKAALKELGYRGDGVCLALPSRMVVASRINGRDIPRNRRRTGLLSLLEEQLPMDIETMTADFLPTVNNWSLGVVVQTAEVKELVDTLESAGITVSAICPTAVMALYSLCRGGDKADYALLRSTQRDEDDRGEAQTPTPRAGHALAPRVDIFRLVDAKPVAWYAACDDPAEIRECIMADQLTNAIDADHITAWVVADAGWPDESLIAAMEMKIVRRQEESPLVTAARSADDVLGGQGGWINLRRDGLATAAPWAPFKPLVRVTAAIAILLPLVLAAAFCWTGMQYSSAADESWQQEVAAFRKLNPHSPVPPGEGLNLRLNSDLMRLKGISGSAGQVPPRVNSLETLRQIMAGLPAGIHLRVLGLQVSPTAVLIQGQARTHSDAEAVNRALAACGLSMESPGTESLPGGGVSYTLAGKPAPPSKAPAATSQPAAPIAPATEPVEETVEEKDGEQ